MISAAVLTSIPFLAGVLFVVGVLKGWVKLGSALFGAACGALIGGVLLRNVLSPWLSSGMAWGGSFIHSAVGGISVFGFTPAETIPDWGWPVIFASLVVVLALIPMVGVLDGGKK